MPLHRLLNPARSLRARFALVIGGSGLAMALLAALVVDGIQRTQLTEQQGRAMRREAELISRNLSSALRQRLRQLQDTASHPLLASGLYEPGDARLLLENLRTQQPALAWLALVDPAGRVQVATNALLEGVDLSQERWFAEAMRAPWVGPRQPAGALTSTLGLVDGRPPYLLDIGLPMIDMQGRHTGVLVGRLRWEWLAEVHRNMQGAEVHLPGSESLVLGRDERVLLGPPTWLDRTPGFLPAGAGAPRVVAWPGDGDYVTAWARDAESARDGLPVSVVVRQPAALAFQPASELRSRLLLLGGLASLGFMALSLWLAARVARPIQKLSEAAMRVVHDQPPQFAAIPPRRQDEVAELARVLEQLHGELSRRLEEQRRAQAALHELNAQLEQRVAARTSELQAANAELDAFAYAVSHDLRAPLRAMSGFSQALLEDHGDRLDADARQDLDQIMLASRRMGDLIEGLLTLSRSVRGTLADTVVDLSALAAVAVAELRRGDPERQVTVEIQPGLSAFGDRRMLAAALANLLGNAWKYTTGRGDARISFSAEERDGERWFCVVDNGVGFDMAHAGRLFQAFGRLHRQDEFPGLGIGLATVQRIVRRHGGRIEAWSSVGAGATFRFTLPARALAVPTEAESS